MSEEKIPTGGKKKPLEKKTFNLSDFKKNIGLEDAPYKPFEWIKVSKALQKAIGLPGIAKGYINMGRGYSNTGKSTLLCEVIVAAQKANIFPIIIDTENNLGLKRLIKMGFDPTKEHLIIDNEFLLEQFGKAKDKKRNDASIEDLAECINFFLDKQDEGLFPYEILFAIDSIGTLDCIRTINANETNSSDNNMWNAGAYERKFKYLINTRIPNSKKINKKFTNTMFVVQKVWLDSMSGAGVLKNKGGEAFYSASRLIIDFGGVQSHGTSKVVATSNKRDVSYGIKTKVSIAKNHLDDIMGGISLKGEIISTPHGFIGTDKEDIDAYKKENISFFREILGDDSINAKDIGTKYEEVKKFNDDDDDIQLDVDKLLKESLENDD